MAGLVAGVFAKVADEAGFAYGAGWSVWALLGQLGSLLGVWVVAIVVIARRQIAPSQSAVAAAAFFVAMCTGYYAWSKAFLGFGGNALYLFWGLAAVTAVPALAAGLTWGRVGAGRDWLRALPPGTAVGLLVAELLQRGLWATMVMFAALSHTRGFLLWFWRLVG